MWNGDIAVCIGCGCDDNHACEDLTTCQPCSWIRVDRGIGLGVCSSCPEDVDRWDNGNRNLQNRGPSQVPPSISWKRSKDEVPTESGKILIFFRGDIHKAIYDHQELTVDIPELESLWDFSDDAEWNPDKDTFAGIIEAWCPYSIPNFIDTTQGVGNE